MIMTLSETVMLLENREQETAVILGFLYRERAQVERIAQFKADLIVADDDITRLDGLLTISKEAHTATANHAQKEICTLIDMLDEAVGQDGWNMNGLIK